MKLVTLKVYNAHSKLIDMNMNHESATILFMFHFITARMCSLRVISKNMEFD